MRVPFRVVVPQLIFAALGFVPISSLAACLVGLCPLYLSARSIVLPLPLLALALGLRYREWGRLALTGFAAGIIATMLYDVVRLGLVAAGLWHDFIPNIGTLLFDPGHPSIFWGYLWRFTCNGGAMGMAYAVLPLRGTWGGLAFGTFVCLCLFGTLLVAPEAQQVLFELRFDTALAALVGHWIYGAALGGLCQRWLPLPSLVPAAIRTRA